jgi:hypothetical protein
VPEQARKDLRARFRSPDDIVHLGAFTELYCIALLKLHGFAVQAHSTTSPKDTYIDFLATRDGTPALVLESVVAGDYETTAWEHKLVRSLYDELNKTQHPDFFVMAELRSAGKQAPSGRKARGCVESKLQEVAWAGLWSALASGNEAAVPEWVWQDKGWEIAFKPLPKAPEYRGTVEGDSLIVGAQMDRVRSGMPGAAWLEPLEKKASRYGKPDLPYIIAVNGLSMFHRLSMLPEALFGLQKIDIDLRTGRGTPGRVPNGLWWGPKGPRYTRVSGVLALEHVRPWSVVQRNLELWHNPWAEKPASPEWWLVTQWLPDGSGKMTERSGKTAAEFFGLDPSWPEGDEED